MTLQQTHWTLTIFDYEAQGFPFVFEEMVDLGQLRFAIAGKEICPETKREHLQCHVQFFQKKSWYAVANLFAPNHVEPAKDPDASIAYCKKEGQYVEYGSAVHSGSRVDLKTIREWMKEGKDLKFVVENCTSLQQIKYAEKYLEVMTKQRNAAVSVYWLWGDTGVGKTRRADTMAKAMFGDNVYWAGANLK